jgi:hypothetical protein
MRVTTEEDKAWLAELELRLRGDIDVPLRRQTVERLWSMQLLRDSEAELLLGVLLYPQLTERQLLTVHSIKLRLLARLDDGKA